ALPTGRDSSGFRNVLYPRANASRECSSDQLPPAGQRRVARRLSSALESVHRSQDMDNRCALLAWGKASRPPAIQNLTARTSVAVCEPWSSLASASWRRARRIRCSLCLDAAKHREDPYRPTRAASGVPPPPPSLADAPARH